MNSSDEPVSARPEEIESLLERVRRNQLGEQDLRLLERLLRLLLSVVRPCRYSDDRLLLACLHAPPAGRGQWPAPWTRSPFHPWMYRPKAVGPGEHVSAHCRRDLS